MENLKLHYQINHAMNLQYISKANAAQDQIKKYN